MISAKIHSYQAWLSSSLSFLALFCYGLYFSTTGFDVTDTGFNLSNQWAAIQGWIEYQWGPIWLADLIGGAWLKISPIPGLFGAHLGWCALIGANAALVCAWLRQWLASWQASLLAILVGIILTPGRLKIIYYSNLSASFLMLAACASFFYFKNSQSNIKQGLLSGFFLATAFHSRFPALLAIFSFPLIPSAYYLVKEFRITANIFLKSIRLFAFIVVFVIFYFLLLLLFGDEKNYLLNMQILLGLNESSIPLPEHELSHVTSMLLKQLFWKPLHSLAFTCIIVLSPIFMNFYTNYKIWWIKWVGHCSLFLSSTAFVLFLISRNENDFRAIIGSAQIFASIIAILLLLVSRNRLIKYPLVDSISLALLYFFAASTIAIAGTPIGLLNFGLASWLLLPSLFLIFNFIFFPSREPSPSMGLGLLLLLFPLAVKSVEIRYHSPYRDYFRRDLMTHSFENPQLKYIHTLKGRAQSFGGFLSEAEKLVKPGDTILAYNGIPMLHYLTQTRPYVFHSWPTVLGIESLKQRLNRPYTEQPPRYIFRALTNTQSQHWGNGVFVNPHNAFHLEAVQYLDQWVERQGYREVWKNQDFIILEKVDRSNSP